MLKTDGESEVPIIPFIIYFFFVKPFSAKSGLRGDVLEYN